MAVLALRGSKIEGTKTHDRAGGVPGYISGSGEDTCGESLEDVLSNLVSRDQSRLSSISVNRSLEMVTRKV